LLQFRHAVGSHDGSALDIPAADIELLGGLPLGRGANWRLYEPIGAVLHRCDFGGHHRRLAFVQAPRSAHNNRRYKNGRARPFSAARSAELFIGLVESQRASRLPDLAAAILIGVDPFRAADTRRTRMDASKNVAWGISVEVALVLVFAPVHALVSFVACCLNGALWPDRARREARYPRHPIALQP
jgi:hypothetical protein